MTMSHFLLKFLILAILAIHAGPTATATEFYVAPEGNDAWSGQLAEPNAEGTDGPWRTLKQAAARVSAGDICYLRAGIYREILRPEHSGRPGKPIVFRNYEGEVAVLSGADPLGGWQAKEGGVFSASMEWDLDDQNQFFDGEALLMEARWPNNTGTLLQPVRAIAASGSPTTLTDSELTGKSDDWNGATLWCAGGSKWICWAGQVTGFDPANRTLTFESEQAAGRWYVPRQGSEYVLMGARAALDTEGEWWLDRAQRRVHFIPHGGQAPDDGQITAKRRLNAIDLSGREHVHIVGLHVRAAGVLTDTESKDLVFDRLDCRYVAHSYGTDVSRENGVILNGERHVLRNSELAVSSGSILRLEGRGHRVINNHIHTGNYGALWSGAVALAGRRHVISHNTIRDSGRDVVTVHGLMESLIQHNDLSHAGWLTHDLGMIYGHDTDFMNTVIRYNHVHNNRAEGHAIGIYFDHLSNNVIVHHNAIWNVARQAVQSNNPSYFQLIAHNTCHQTHTDSRPAITTFDHGHRGDLFGSMWLNNLFNAPLDLPDHVITADNLAEADPGFTDPSARDFGLREDPAAARMGRVLDGVTHGTTPYAGAFPPGQKPWTAGHDFANPPDPEPVWEEPSVFLRNRIYNACFETGTLEGWQTTGVGRARLTEGNGWGYNSETREVEPTGTSKYELRLGGGIDGVEQRVERLEPNTTYRVSAWMRVSDPSESVRMGVHLPDGGEQTKHTSSTEWTRTTLEFSTGSETSDVTVFLEKTSPGPGLAWCDNVGLLPVR